MKSKFIIGIFLLSCLSVMGQSVDDFKGAVSPQVALMNRYGDYPVDLSTGLVDISVPLYTIKTTSLSLPLELKFHASGLQAKEREGMFGIRWALSGGGSVSRIIKGYPDEYYPFNSLVNNPNYTPDFNTLYGTTSTMYQPGGSYNSLFLTDHTFNRIFKTAGQYQDTEYDIYSYTLPTGKSGKFIVQGSTGIPMPYEPLKISVMTNGTGVTIVDEDGVIYRFGGQYVDGNDGGWITTWHLSTITSANQQDVIQLDYIKPDLNTTFYDQSLVISDNLHDNDRFYIDEGLDGPGTVQESELYEMLGELLTTPSEFFKQSNNPTLTVRPYYSLKSIQYKGGGSAIGRVDFSYQKDKYGEITYLDTMIVSDAQSKPVDKIHFLLKDNLSGNLKLLDKLEFLDPSNSNNKYWYTFNYYDSNWVPACGKLSADCDWWGYYSLGAGGLKSTPVTVTAVDDTGTLRYDSMQIVGGDKHSDSTSMKMGMLQSIQYPTGGKTEFEYEANLTPAGDECGGLRIKRVKNEPASGKTESRHYTYGPSTMPDYLYPINYRFHNIYTEHEISCHVDNSPLSTTDYTGEGSYIQRTFQATIPSQFTDFLSNTVYYSDVTEHIENPSGTGDIGRTEYQYNIRLNNLGYYNTPDGYNFEGYPDPSVGYSQAYVSPTDFWRVTELAYKTIYNSTQKIKEYKYDYKPYSKDTIYDLPVFRYRIHRVWMDQAYGSEADNEIEIGMIYPNQVYKTFAFKHQEYTTGANKLIKETEKSYDANGTETSIVKDITYDPVYLLPVSESITNSNGDVIKTEKKYPFDTFDGGLPDMVSYNILTDVIKTNKYKNNTLFESTILNYQPFPSTSIYNTYRPLSVTQMTNGVFETRIFDMQYDSRGNPLYMYKDDNEETAYLWSYNYQYPIAKIVGKDIDYFALETTLNNNLGSNFVSTLAQNPCPTAAQIASIRTCLASKNALITTYTYLPLIGMVSATDPRGVTTTYTYDTFNRLINIKNDDGNVLNQYKYHYYNQ